MERGWSVDERHGATTVVWSDGRESTLDFWLDEPYRYEDVAASQLATGFAHATLVQQFEKRASATLPQIATESRWRQ